MHDTSEIVSVPPTLWKRVWPILVGAGPVALALLELAGHLHLGPGAWAQVVGAAAFLAFNLRLAWGARLRFRALDRTLALLASAPSAEKVDPGLIAALRRLPDTQRPAASRVALWTSIAVSLAFAGAAAAFLAYSVAAAWAG